MQTPKARSCVDIPQVREHGDRGTVVVGEALSRACAAQPMGDEALDEAVLRRVDEHVKPAKNARRAAGRLGHRGHFFAALERGRAARRCS